jgi:peptidoglycan/LPS O-acetylase OafA/YrhL
MAAQVFFVVAGFLLAGKLAPCGVSRTGMKVEKFSPEQTF